MKRRLLLLLAVSCIIAAAVYGSFALYQHHLSSDVKPLLIAACADNVSGNEIRSYLHDARPLLKTTKDQVTFDKLEFAIQLLSSYQQYESASLDRMNAFMEEMRPYNENSECAGKFWRLSKPYARGSYAEVQQAYQQMKDCEKRKEDADAADRKVSEYELQEGRRLYNEVRTTLGLPPIKEH